MPDFTLPGRGGNELVVRVWETVATPRAVVVLCHGYAEHSGRYDHVASRLTQAGYLVVAPDLEGHGRSGGRRARVDLDVAVEDIDLVVDSQARVHPTLKIALLGHSMGGAVALRYAIAHGRRLSGLILSGPLVRLDVALGPRLLAGLAARIAPGLSVANLDPQLVSRDPNVVAAYRSDPLVHHGGVPAVTAANWMAHASTIMSDAAAITLPTLLMWGTADGLCPPAGAEALARSLGSSDLSTRPFDGLFHEIFNEPEREAVLNEVVAWLAARI